MKKLLMDLGIKSKKMADFIKAFSQYLVLKNQVLWEGTAGTGETIKVNGLSKYKTMLVETNYGSFISQANLLRAVHGDWMGGTSQNNSFVVDRVVGTISGDMISIVYSDYLWFSSGSFTHYNTLKVGKITGLEPKISDELIEIARDIIGGGYCLTRLLRWCSHENVHHLKEYTHTNPKCEVAYNQQQHAQKRICCIPEQRKNMLGILFESSIWRKSTSSCFVSRWICNSATRIFVHGILESAIQLLARCISRKSYTIPVRYTDAQQLSIDKAIRYFYNNRILNIRGCSVC